MTLLHEFYMQRCLDLARNGLGSVAPNPMVGAVIVHNDRIIGEGYHTGYGNPHAEAEAVNQVKDQSILPDSTLYVNLEPCNHHGKAPPCTNLILDKGIGRVVIGQNDPNSAASGGLDRLRNKGVEVITGVLEQESRWLNRRFNTFHEQKRPWLILKWAQTTDGFVDTLRDQTENQKPTWITDETGRRLVHKWRTEEQAILAGSQTILLDNPQLNVRAWAGKDPLRITIDRTGRLEMGDRRSPLWILDGAIPTVIYTGTDHKNQPNLEFIRISPEEPVWPQVLADLYNRNIQSVLIEGGPTLVETLIRENLWDEARVFIGPGWFGSGVKAPQFPFQPKQEGKVGNSRLMQFYREDMRTLRTLRR
ncbi:MAG: bifunctional diaminohydroxyphosphoribosylaminopyrimidine deaminase/5-amino-6-(5-phosphoribosylamino)uracil reductase RibD [Porphyromonadaceae bacterium]|nr:MAG: bifunctional diaminohydroxyphosphoribosylaminopyrimidine deaminase/5-amino-6-(5-phosphoribosylamino)uracil reductase RibD [Porphyromonadaceae bacterium]